MAEVGPTRELARWIHPDRRGDIALFADSIGTTNPAVVTLDGNRTVGGIIFNTTLGGSSSSPARMAAR